jgi:hypothetical protein
MSGPWAGIVRLEIPQSAGLAPSIELASEVGSLIPSFAGVPHRDPRAPQNLQPIGALESHLRHLLGDARLAFRAVRDAASLPSQRDVSSADSQRRDLSSADSPRRDLSSFLPAGKE